MSQTPAPPALDPKHDAETLTLLDALDTGSVKDLEANKKALRDHLGTRIAGDLRPRVLAGQTAIAERDAALRDLQAASASLATAQADLKALSAREKAAVELHAQWKKAMTDKGIKLP